MVSDAVAAWLKPRLIFHYLAKVYPALKSVAKKLPRFQKVNALTLRLKMKITPQTLLDDASGFNGVHGLGQLNSASRHSF